MLLAVSFRDQGEKYHEQGSFLTLTLSMKPPEPRGKGGLVVFPDYSYIAKDLAAVLSAYYGKLIEFQGCTESHGSSVVSIVTDTTALNSHHFPFNDFPRKATQVPLDLASSHPVIQALLSYEWDEYTAAIVRAATFYQQALNFAEQQPVLSFTLFLCAIEALIPIATFTEEELMDEQLKCILKKIRTHVPHPEKTVNVLKSRLFQIKRKCSLLMEMFLDADFFENPECDDPRSTLSPETAPKAIKAAYDLRSAFLHTGKHHGVWAKTYQGQHAEVVIGEPRIDDRNLRKLVMASPTWIGLERMVQYTLCSVIHELLFE